MKSTEEATANGSAEHEQKTHIQAPNQHIHTRMVVQLQRKNGAQSSAEVYKCFSGIHLTRCGNVHFGQGVVNN